MSEPNARSTSRSRGFAFVGRGGAGNIVRSEPQSRAQIARADDGDERGRDIAPRSSKRITHAGRGGQGNVRSPSRDPAKDAAERAFEEEVLRKSRESNKTWGISSGRGGVGNISRSKSRSHSHEPNPASGRGGFNFLSRIIQPNDFDLESLDEEESIAADAKLHGV